MKEPNTAQARKLLMDFMDEKRPWANCPDVYVAMEEIADYAAYAFVGEIRPKKEDVKRLESDLLRFTAALVEHPDRYEGPCNCQQCLIDNAD